MTKILTDDTYIPHRYSRDDLMQLAELLKCASDDLEDNLIFFDMDSEQAKIFEVCKNHLNKTIQILINYNERTKSKYKEI